MTTPLLQVHELTKHFPITGGPAGIRTIGQVRAVDGVSFDLAEGETLALVGESGCGKSTTGRMLLRLTEPTSGSIAFGGDDLLSLGHSALRRRRREMQIVFQDPYASLSPRQRVEDIVAEPLDVYRLCASHGERRDRVGRTAAPGRTRCDTSAPLSVRVLRRPAPAHRHRPRAGTGTEADRRR